MFKLVKEFSCSATTPDLLLVSTMKRIKFIRRKKLFLKSAPAIAASFIIIAGAGIFNAGLFTTGRQSVIADKSAYGLLSDSERLIEIIRKHNATISDITQDYVEGTVPVATFDRLRREFGARKVAYLPEEGSGAVNIDWGNAIEEVGAGDIRSWEQQGHTTGAPKRYIRFRVFR
jgi:hypothetical protein